MGTSGAFGRPGVLGASDLTSSNMALGRLERFGLDESFVGSNVSKVSMAFCTQGGIAVP
jgi:hypothetical protein